MYFAIHESHLKVKRKRVGRREGRLTRSELTAGTTEVYESPGLRRQRDTGGRAGAGSADWFRERSVRGRWQFTRV